MGQWYCHASGQQYGPVTEETLREWLRQGRVRPADLVWTEGMGNWAQAGSIPSFFASDGGLTPPVPPTATALKRHRGGAILTLGILGLLVCAPLGIAAWVMGNTDLREMDAGLMDPTGRDTTQGGRICGMIATIIMLCVLGFFLLVTLIGIAGSLA